MAIAKKKTKAVVDKWKTKVWYTVLAPEIFERKEIAETVATDEKILMNRIVSRPLVEFVGAGSQTAMFTNLHFRITDVKGKTANTKLIGHTIDTSYIRSFARRRKSLVHRVVDIKTKDDESLRVKVIAITGSRVSENAKRNIRTAIDEQILAEAGQYRFDEIMQEILYGRLTSRLYNRLKQITPMKRVEVRRTVRLEQFK